MRFLTSGEVNALVRSANGQDGFVAWNKLFENYNPRTPARALKMIFEIINPTKPKNLVQLVHCLEDWEMKIANWESEFNEKLPEAHWFYLRDHCKSHFSESPVLSYWIKLFVQFSPPIHLLHNHLHIGCDVLCFGLTIDDGPLLSIIKHPSVTIEY